jgi:hypothetical protein
MQNRIKRLEYEERRVEKSVIKTEERAEKMVETRKRHFQQLVMRKNHHIYRK